MIRPPDWQERMIKALKLKQSLPFSWGSHDCALFACDIVQAICSVDFALLFRGKYETEKEAHKVLKAFAGGGLEQVIEKLAKEHDCKEVPILKAQQGDIMLAEVLTPGDVFRDSLGICVGERIAFASKKGLVQLPLSSAKRAWRTP